MRKIFAISVLFLHLFNLAGYRLFFNYYINRSDQQIVAMADNNRYLDCELKEIKIKLNLPYIMDWPAYERYDGSISINGQHYNFVKRKIAQDTLYLLCFLNEAKSQLNKNTIDYAAKTNNTPSENNANSRADKYVFTSEFKQGCLSYNFDVPDMTAQIVFENRSESIENSYHPDNAGEPPEKNC